MDEDNQWVVTHQGIVIPLAEVLRAIGQIKCVTCGLSGLGHHDLDHVLVDPFEQPTGAASGSAPLG